MVDKKEKVINIEKTFISLFGGIGGFDLAFQRQGWKCVWYNDWDKYAVQTYNKNFQTNYEPTDITKVDAKRIPEHTLLCAGFPCQSFSLAGKRKGFQDTRGTMFFEICRIIKECRTPFLLLENVKGLLSHDEGKTFFVILKCLDELGYDAEWQVLNSKHFSVPQNRERVFIIASFRGKPKKQVFPITEDAGTIPEVFEGEEIMSPCITQATGRWGCSDEEMSQVNAVARCLDANMRKGVNPESFFERKERNLVYDRKGFDSRTKGFRESEEVPTLSVKMGTGGNNVPMVVSHSPRSGNPKKGGTGILASEEHAFTLDSTPHIVAQRGHENGQTFEPNSESNSLTGVQKDNFVFSNGLRRLTPLECERLQGFPDKWTKGVSDTQRYKQLGNTVTVNVIEAIARKINEVYF